MKVLLIPFSIWLLVELFKFFRRGLASKKYTLENFMQYGGMPSAHSVYVASLCTMVALQSGIWSVPFGIAFVFAGFLIRDAIYLRMIVQRQSIVLNYLRSKLSPDEQTRYPALNEHVGHTVTEVEVGVAVGVGLTLLLNSLF